MDILPQLIANSLIAGSTYALVAMSFNLIYGVSRTFNLAHGALGTVAAYTVFFLAKQDGLPLAAAIPLGIAAAACAGLLLERSIFLNLRAKKASDKVLIISSLGALVAIEALVAICFTTQFKTLSGLIVNSTVFIGGAAITGVQLTILAASGIVFVSFWFLLSYTRFGKAVRAIADDEEVAKIVGIDTNRIIAFVTVIGASVMGLAGILAGFDTGLEPHMGFLLFLDGAIAAVVGGIGNIYGAFLAAFLLGFAENFGVWAVSGEWKYAIAFCILIGFLLFRPQGFFGSK